MKVTEKTARTRGEELRREDASPCVDSHWDPFNLQKNSHTYRLHILSPYIFYHKIGWNHYWQRDALALLRHTSFTRPSKHVRCSFFESNTQGEFLKNLHATLCYMTVKLQKGRIHFCIFPCTLFACDWYIWICRIWELLPRSWANDVLKHKASEN